MLILLEPSSDTSSEFSLSYLLMDGEELHRERLMIMSNIFEHIREGLELTSGLHVCKL